MTASLADDDAGLLVHAPLLTVSDTWRIN